MLINEKYAEKAVNGDTKQLWEIYELIPEDEQDPKEQKRLEEQYKQVKYGIKEKFRITWTPEISPELENKRWWDKISVGYILIANSEQTRTQIPYEAYEEEMEERKKIMRKTIMQKTEIKDPYKPRNWT